MKKHWFVVALAAALRASLLQAQWIPQTMPSGIRWLQSVDFIDANRGAATGTGISESAIYTTNGGIVWNLSQVPESTRNISALQFVDFQMGYGGGSLYTNDPNPRGLFLITTDAGQSWDMYGTLPDSISSLLGMSFVNTHIGFVTAYDGTDYFGARILKTTNAGLTWIRLTIPDSIVFLPKIAFLDSSVGFAVGYQPPFEASEGLILKTTNGGLTWTRDVFSRVHSFNDIYFGNSSTGYVVGSDTTTPRRSVIYKTTNTGSQWFPSAVTGDSVSLEGIRFTTNIDIGFVYGMGPSFQPIIGKTTDGGIDWDYQGFTSFPLGTALLGADFITDSVGYICGGGIVGFSYDPVMFHTTNAGILFASSLMHEKVPAFNLFQNYPNPFNPATTIEYEIPRQEYVVLKIYTPLGQEVATLVNKLQPSGRQTAIWNGKSSNGAAVPSGVYIYKLRAGDYAEFRKLIFIR